MHGLQKLFLLSYFLFFCGLAFANQNLNYLQEKGRFYVSGNLGVVRVNNNVFYNDLTDVIAQNIAESLQDYGYSGGVGFGYSKLYKNLYLIGFDLSINVNSNRILFMSGAANAAFTNKTKVTANLDFALEPGLVLDDSLIAYLKIGPSFANVSDKLISPVGFTPTYLTYKSNQVVVGLVLGLGLKKYINPRTFIFGEYNFHDYGKVNFDGFQNFTASYSHSNHIYLNHVIIGVAYHV